MKAKTKAHWIVAERNGRILGRIAPCSIQEADRIADNNFPQSRLTLIPWRDATGEQRARAGQLPKLDWRTAIQGQRLEPDDYPDIARKLQRHFTAGGAAR